MNGIPLHSVPLGAPADGAQASPLPASGAGRARPPALLFRPGQSNERARYLSSEFIQEYLDENVHLIIAITENQNLGKVQECSKFQMKLHQNLLYLASLADCQPQGQSTAGQANPNVASGVNNTNSAANLPSNPPQQNGPSVNPVIVQGYPQAFGLSSQPQANPHGRDQSMNQYSTLQSKTLGQTMSATDPNIQTLMSNSTQSLSIKIPTHIANGAQNGARSGSLPGQSTLQARSTNSSFSVAQPRPQYSQPIELTPATSVVSSQLPTRPVAPNYKGAPANSQGTPQTVPQQHLQSHPPSVLSQQMVHSQGQTTSIPTQQTPLNTSQGGTLSLSQNHPQQNHHTTLQSQQLHQQPHTQQIHHQTQQTAHPQLYSQASHASQGHAQYVTQPTYPSPQTQAQYPTQYMVTMQQPGQSTYGTVPAAQYQHTQAQYVAAQASSQAQQYAQQAHQAHQAHQQTSTLNQQVNRQTTIHLQFRPTSPPTCPQANILCRLLLLNRSNFLRRATRRPPQRLPLQQPQQPQRHRVNYNGHKKSTIDFLRPLRGVELKTCVFWRPTLVVKTLLK